MRRQYILIVIIGVLLVPIGARGRVMSSEFSSSAFLLDDGTLTYTGWTYYHTPAVVDPYDIEISTNISRTQTTEITSLSDTVVQFEATIHMSAESIYQKRLGIYYYPESYGIRFFDEEFNLLGSDDTSFDVVSQVNKETGIRTLLQVPYGASWFVFTSFFDDPLAYEWVGSFPMPFGEVGKESGLFMHNASEWEIGTIVRENTTVTGESTYDGFETWIVQPRENLEGYDTFSVQMEFEKNSGLFLREDWDIGNTNSFTMKFHMRATDFADVIIIPVSPLVPIVMVVGAGGVIAIVVIAAVVFMKRR